jgi:hypothetical protein
VTINQPRDDVAKTRKQLWNLGDGGHPSLEAVTRRLVKMRKADKTEVCAVVNCRLSELAIELELFFVTNCLCTSV